MTRLRIICAAVGVVAVLPVMVGIGRASATSLGVDGGAVQAFSLLATVPQPVRADVRVAPATVNASGSGTSTVTVFVTLPPPSSGADVAVSTVRLCGPAACVGPPGSVHVQQTGVLQIKFSGTDILEAAGAARGALAFTLVGDIGGSAHFTGTDVITVNA